MSDRSTEACVHRRIDVLVAIQADGMPGMWACHDCKLRFYPACRTCVDVGHRNVVHPAATRESAGVGLDDELMKLAIRFWVRYRCEMIGCVIVEPHEHDGGPPTREMTADERLAAARLAAAEGSEE